MKGELDLWYEMWDRGGSQGLDTWYDMRGRLKGEEGPSAVQGQILDSLDGTAGILWGVAFSRGLEGWNVLRIG